MPTLNTIKGALVALAGLLSFTAMADGQRIEVPAGDLISALQLLERQAEIDLVYQDAQVKGLKTAGVSGNLSAQEALTKLLEGTKLKIKRDEASGAILITPEGAKQSSQVSSTSALHMAQGENGAAMQAVDASPSQAAQDGEDESQENKGIPEILVRDSKVLNMDIKRSRDDAQPYVIFDRETIANSGATNLEDFLKQRLTMESTALSESQGDSLLGTRSSVNLRGLGTDQTLILVDGHRMAGVTAVGGIYQPDINGIPLASIERIEILPTSASGIYGGSATGGVVNIILRRDYSGVETKLTYDNTFDTDASRRRIDLSAGATVEGGKTSLMLSGSYADGTRLLMQDRDFMARNRQRIFENNAAYLSGRNPPPVGGTANIRSSNGSNLVLDNLTPLNSPITFLPEGYAGPSGPQGDGGLALVANAGRYNLGTADTIDSGRRPLLNTPVVQSLMLTVRREFTSNLNAFLEVSGSNNIGEVYAVDMSDAFTLPADNINNPFNTAIRVTSPLTGLQGTSEVVSHDRRLVTGIIGKLPHNWRMGLDVSFDRSRYSGRSVGSSDAALAAVTAGTLNVMRDVNTYPIDFSQYIDEASISFPTHAKMNDYTARSSGPLFSLPAGPVNLSMLVERREETFEPSLRQTPGLPPGGTPEEQSQDVNSAYLEATVPLVSSGSAFPGVRMLELQLAGRWDEYTSSGTNRILFPDDELLRGENKFSSTNGTVALRYQPMEDITLRASFGTGFLPPAVNQLVPGGFAFPGFFFDDPLRADPPAGDVNLIDGGNENLKPERSETSSAGLIFTPRLVEGLRLSIDWYRIEKRDNMVAPDLFEVLADEGRPGGTRFPGRVIRGPVDGDPSGVGPVIAIDASLINLARAKVEGYDLAADYHFATSRFGTLEMFALGTITKHSQTQTFADSPVEEHVGLVTSQGQAIGSGNYPLKFKGNLGVTWNYQEWKAGWTARYLDSYQIDAGRVFNSGGEANVILAQGNGGRVPSQTYHDLFVSYSFNSPAMGMNFLTGTEWQLGVRNVFNTEPPLDVSNTSGYYSGFADPRLASYYLSAKKSF